MPSHTQYLQKELQRLEDSENRLHDLEQQYAKQSQAFEVAALKLRASRQAHATKLAQEISASIQKLGMPKGRVEIDISPLDKMQAQGLDKVEYKVCTNPGMLPDSLAKIASGGELSRISLAIQMILHNVALPLPYSSMKLM